MRPRSCCHAKGKAQMGVVVGSRRPSRWERLGEVTGWLVPSTLLVLLPKCPVCVAAYVALATGVGISLPVASSLRMGLVVLCVGCLLVMVVKRCRRWVARREA